jgi:hypothetical protein
MNFDPRAMNQAPRHLRYLKWLAPPAVRQRLRRVWDAVYCPWRRFWFEPADPTPLAVMRILFGGMLLYTHIVWGLNLEGFFGPSGWQSATLVRMLQANQAAWSFWWWIPQGLHFSTHLACLAILAMFMLGAFTPITSVLAYLITISYASRAPMANYGLDQINGLAALYLAIGPSGRVLSIDRLRQRFRLARGQLAEGHEPAVPPVPPSPRANLALRLVQVHLCVIYIFACLSKLQGESWWNGTAIWQAVANLEYQSRDMTWLAAYPWLVNLLTHATIAWEMTFWALVWRPMLRPFVLLVGTAIHLGIGAFMGMWTFGLAVIFAYVAFLPGKPISGFLRWAQRWIGRFLARLNLAPTASASVAARATWFALGLDPGEEPAPTEPAAAAIPVRAGASPAAETQLPAASNVESAEATAPSDRQHASREARDAGRTRPSLLPPRPSILLVEGRLKRQVEVQDYFLNHGFRCHVASELHQARSILAVINIDALIVTSSWFPEDELAEFHEGLLGGGDALPASVFLLGSAPGQMFPAFEENPRHRVVVGSLSLRELRMMVLGLLGVTEKEIRPSRRHSHSTNGRRRASRNHSTPKVDVTPDPSESDASSIAGGNGTPHDQQSSPLN